MADLRWTHVTAVQNHLNDYDLNSVTDATITAILIDSEQYVRSLIHEDSGGTTIYDNYDVEKHRVLKETAEIRAAMILLAGISLSPKTLKEAALTLDMLSYALEGNLKLLSDQNYTNELGER